MLYELSHKDSDRNVVFLMYPDGSAMIQNLDQHKHVTLTKHEMMRLKEIVKGMP